MNLKKIISFDTEVRPGSRLYYQDQGPIIVTAIGRDKFLGVMDPELPEYDYDKKEVYWRDDIGVEN